LGENCAARLASMPEEAILVILSSRCRPGWDHILSHRDSLIFPPTSKSEARPGRFS
jgi:hypothetical protein